MFWNKKISIEKQKEIRLNVFLVEKLIQRTLDCTNDALISFDKSYADLFANSDELPNDFKAVASVTQFMSAHQLIQQNEKILGEIKPLINSRLLKAPSVIREGLKKAQEKNDRTEIMFLSHRMARREEGVSDEPMASLLKEIILSKNSRSDLLQLTSSLNDFQTLFQKHFLASSFEYINENRIDEFRQIESDNFDLSKLIRLCEELNSSYQNQNYLSVTMLVRAILDHVPPVFGFSTFVEVSNNYGGKSLKKSLQNLQNSSRNIADAYLHGPIRPKENLPNETQVDFRNDLDVVLGEVIRILK